MTEADVANIEGVLAACPEAAQWSPGQVLREALGSSFALVAENDGQVVGITVLRNAADEAELLNLAVAPMHRRSGFGRELLTAALDYGRKAGAKRAFLEVRASNAGACAFYAKLGFTAAGLRRDYYRDPIEDALVLSKVLA